VRRVLGVLALVGPLASVSGLAAPALADADAPSVDLAALARSSERPEECAAETEAETGVWDRARAPGLDEYCDALVLGYAALTSNPSLAKVRATVAERERPGSDPPLLLTARANHALGDERTAFDEFETVRKRSPRTLERLGALVDYAHAALETGHFPEALAAYRVLVPRVALLDGGCTRARILVEASMLTMREGRAHLADAIGTLNEARQVVTCPELRDAVLASLALALSRQGRAAEADGVVSETDGPYGLEAEREREQAKSAAGIAPPSKSPPPAHERFVALPPGELDAMIAILAEHHDRELALERWQSYAESEAGKRGPFAAHARAAHDALARGAKKAP
jgi:hypothetical protein